jgi:serine/threonine protein kinase/CheY-like chemotaxis protein
MRLIPSTRRTAEDGEMSQSILLIEYEPRYVDRVRKALENSYRLEVVADLDAAVEVCAGIEPSAVILTSVLPRIKIEDAITQLRARAGLRTTPFLILMSGYRGSDPQADAARYGAQDILERPFSGEALIDRVRRMVEAAASPATTQAIPQEMLEALRRTAGLEGSEPSLTSDDLFGDILTDVESDKEKPASPPTPSPPTHDPKTPAPSARADSDLDDMLKSKPASPPIKRQAPPSETDVDAILSQTLAGLDIQPMRRKPKSTPPSPAPASPAPKSAPPSQPPVSPPPSAPPATAEPAPKPSSPAPVSSGSQFGQYILQEHIATGGMAEVYKARMMGMEGFQKTVAIKRILPHLTDNDEFVSMFIDEAKLAAQLNHNNIIHIYDLGKIDRSHYIAMEYIEGRDLRSILQNLRERDEAMPIPLALYITTLLASALDYAHNKRDFENQELGLVHRDVSPQNVLISNAGDIKLCDFGIAKAASKASHTRAGALKGKLQYMSPEQAWGKDIDLRSDIFSLALVCYEMLTGDKLFAGDSELSILEQVRNPTVNPPSGANPDIPPEVERIVLKALEADRNRRYQSAREMQRDLEGVMRQKGWTANSVSLARLLQELSEGAPITGAPARPAAAPEPPAPEPMPSPEPKSPVVPLSKPVEEPSLSLDDERVSAAPAHQPESEPAPEPVVVSEVESDVDVLEDEGKGSKTTMWLLIGAAALVVIAGGLYMLLGSGGVEKARPRWSPRCRSHPRRRRRRSRVSRPVAC